MRQEEAVEVAAGQATAPVIEVEDLSLTFETADGPVFALSEVMDGDHYLLTFEEDGEPLDSLENGGRGPLWLIISQEKKGEFNGQYSVKFVFLVEVR